MLRKGGTTLTLLAIASLGPRHALAQQIHLKARPAPPMSQETAQPMVSPESQPQAAAAHWIVEFDHAPGAADLAAITAAGVDVTGAVPDNAVIVSGSAARIAGAHFAGVRGAGPMRVSDKLSPELQRDSSPLQVLVEFHADVSNGVQDAIAALEGLTLTRAKVLLPGHALVSAFGDRLQALAAHDEVAYIFPADPALGSESNFMGCAGMLTVTGKVGQYANIVHGWDLGSDKAAHLGYIFGALTPKVPDSAVQSEILRALNEWAKNTNVIFQPASGPAASQTVYIRFASGSHGDGYPFDGAGGTLAHTFYPVPVNPESIAGDMHLDADENWHTGGDVDIYSVALHEAGHALGLGHSDKPGDVMYPYYRRNMALSPNDIGAVQQLYGAPSGSNTPPSAPAAPAPPTPPETPPVTPTDPVPAPAALTLTPDSAPASTQATEITLTGTFSGGTGTITIQWQTNSGATGSASISGSAWNASGIALDVGSNIITLSAFDAANHSASKTVSVTRVQTATAIPAPSTGPPFIRIASPAGPVVSATSSTLKVTGTAAAGAGISHVSWQGTGGASGQAVGTNQWVIDALPLLTGTNTIILRVYDNAGNSAWASMIVVRQ